MSLLRRAHDHHRDLRTRLPAAAVAYPINRARQFMTFAPLSPSPITASVRRRYLTGTGHASQTATVSTAFGRQNLEHQIPDHCADRIQGGQDQRPAGPSTVVLSGTDKSDPAAAPNSPQIDTSVGANSPRGFLPRGFSDACLSTSLAPATGRHPKTLNDSGGSPGRHCDRDVRTERKPPALRDHK